MCYTISMVKNMKYSTKKENILFIAMIFFIIGIVFIWILINHLLIMKGYKELQITDNWQFFEFTKTGLIGEIDDFVEDKKISLQNRLNNYFPFYQELTSSFYSQVINNNKLLYKDNYPISLNSDSEYVFYNNTYNFYYLINKRSESDLEKRVDSQIDFFNSLRKSNKDVSMNLYYIPRFEQLDFLDNNLSKYKTKFEEGLSNEINFSELQIKNPKDYTKKFYKTDHHWNMYGAYEGYKDIMKMLNKDSMDLTINRVSTKPYYGSLAKSSLSKLTNDDITDITYRPKYNTSISNLKKLEKFKPRKITYQKDYDFFDYYVHYFDGQTGLTKYTYESDSLDNLLIFSDSYAWQIDYLIAKEFKNTYVVNLRYDEYKNGKFDYNEFIKDNNITDVLFLYEGSSLIFDQYDYNFNNKIERR